MFQNSNQRYDHGNHDNHGNTYKRESMRTTRITRKTPFPTSHNKENEYPLRNSNNNKSIIDHKRRSNNNNKSLPLLSSSSNTAIHSPSCLVPSSSQSSLSTTKPSPYYSSSSSSMQIKKSNYYQSQRRHGSNYTAATSVLTEDSSRLSSSSYDDEGGDNASRRNGSNRIHSSDSHTTSISYYGAGDNSSFDIIEVDSSDNLSYDNDDNDDDNVHNDNEEEVCVDDHSCCQSTTSTDHQHHHNYHETDEDEMDISSTVAAVVHNNEHEQQTLTSSSRTLYHDTISIDHEIHDDNNENYDDTSSKGPVVEDDNESFVTALVLSPRLEAMNTITMNEEKNYKYSWTATCTSSRNSNIRRLPVLTNRQPSLDIPSHILSSVQFNDDYDDDHDDNNDDHADNNDDHDDTNSDNEVQNETFSLKPPSSLSLRCFLPSSATSSLSSTQWKHLPTSTLLSPSQTRLYEEWMPEQHQQQQQSMKNKFQVTHIDNGSFVSMPSPTQKQFYEEWMSQGLQQPQQQQRSHINNGSLVSLQLVSTPPSYVSRQQSMDIPSQLLSSVKLDDDDCFILQEDQDGFCSSPDLKQQQEQQQQQNFYQHNHHPLNMISTKTPIQNRNQESKSILGVFKRLFTFDNKERNMLVMTTPSPLVAAGSKKKSNHGNTFCIFPMNICTEAVESPVTPEYEKECKKDLLKSSRKMMILSPNQSRQDESTSKKDRYNQFHPNSRNNNNNAAMLRTVKRKNNSNENKSKTYTIPNPALAKTIKKRNTSLTERRESSYVIMDETQQDSNKINVYEANSKTEQFIKSKECFYSGFDGTKNHYTYVSPKKQNDGDEIYTNCFPDECNNIITNPDNPRQISSPVPQNSRTKLNFQSPELEKATTVVHVVSPKNTNYYNSNLNHQNKNRKSLRGVGGHSFDTSSNSMESGERRIVNGFLENANTAGNWKFQQSDIPSIPLKQYPPVDELNCYDNTKPFKRKNQNAHMANIDVDDQTVQTYGTMGTTGTMHRRTNSTTTFTATSLAQIFDVDFPLQERQLNVSPTYQVIPQTISKISRAKRDIADDDESLISPLGNDGDESITAFSFDDSLAKNVLHEWSNHAKLAKKVVLPPEPAGVYMPNSNVFKEDVNGRHMGSCLEGWLAFSKGSRLLEALEKDEQNISRRDLRYIVIENNSMYVYTSKKSKTDVDTSIMDQDLSIDVQSTTNKNNADKVLNLSRGMKVEVKFISKRHGHCVCVIDKKISKVVCTLLPVRLNPDFFRDEDYSQVIGSKKFKRIRENLIGLNSDSCSSYEDGNEKEVVRSKSGQWPIYMPQIAPDDQNTSALCLQFALDAATNFFDY